ncbi:MAG: PEP-CTERM sorting domain-containing protein [Planctomycetes bacterium]|nr:PEP-CTERM sorting domain-containing protein [Planctomycetota bacterium]
MVKIAKKTFLMLLIFSSLAYSRIITIEVTGTVNELTYRGGLRLDNSISMGSVMSGSCSYDTEAISLDGYNYPLLSITMIVGDYIFKHDAFTTDLAYISIGGDKVYAPKTWDGVFDGNALDNGEIKTFDEIEWSRAYFELFNIYSTLPECPYPNYLPESIDLSLFNERKEFSANFLKADSSSDISSIYFKGELTSLTVIPEPCSLVLLGLGAIGLLSKRR